MLVDLESDIAGVDGVALKKLVERASSVEKSCFRFSNRVPLRLSSNEITRNSYAGRIPRFFNRYLYENSAGVWLKGVL